MKNLPIVLAMLVCATAGRAVFAQTAPESSAPPAAGADARVQEARDRYRDGVAAFGARRFGDAVVNFERSMRLHPHPNTLYNAAQAWLRSGDRDRAIEELRQVLAMTSPAPDAATIERARALAREAGVNDLQPAEVTHEPTCPACPTCPTAPPCPTVPATTVSAASHGVLPHILAGAGIAFLAVGLAFYGNALGDAYAYAQLDPGTTPQSAFNSIRSQGEVFRVVGLIGVLIGAGSAGTAVALYLNPTRHHAPGSAARPAPAVTARVDVGLGSLLVSGTF